MAMEGLPLHFILFTKIWSEIYNKSHEVLSIKLMKFNLSCIINYVFQRGSRNGVQLQIFSSLL